jgi:hypothetical protein
MPKNPFRRKERMPISKIPGNESCRPPYPMNSVTDNSLPELKAEVKEECGVPGNRYLSLDLKRKEEFR